MGYLSFLAKNVRCNIFRKKKRKNDSGIKNKAGNCDI